MIAAIRDHSPDDAITVTVVRDGDEQTFDVTLAERPARLTANPLVVGPRGHR